MPDHVRRSLLICRMKTGEGFPVLPGSLRFMKRWYRFARRGVKFLQITGVYTAFSGKRRLLATNSATSRLKRIAPMRAASLCCGAALRRHAPMRGRKIFPGNRSGNQQDRFPGNIFMCITPVPAGRAPGVTGRLQGSAARASVAEILERVLPAVAYMQADCLLGGSQIKMHQTFIDLAVIILCTPHTFRIV